MKVGRVCGTIKYSLDTGHGAWKAVEIGAEASVGDREGWSQALAHLYGDLGQQLKTLWANGRNEKGQESTVSPNESLTGQTATLTTPAAPHEHYCQDHQVEFKRYSRGNQVWYAHRLPDGKWCRERE